MADEIISKLGFNVEDALAALDKLDKKLQAVNQTTMQWAQTLDKFKGSRIATQLGQVSRAADTTGKSAARMGEHWAVSLDTLSRVVMTQFIVRALSQIRRAFEQTSQSAIAYQRQAAETATIAGGQLGSIPQIGAIARTISDEYNVALDDTGKALYQTISNQISAGQSAEFLGQASLFAKGGVTDLESSVNLLSGTLNAYGMNADQAGDIAAKFFRTIELGRTTASELSQNFGKVAPLANQLGVSIEELDAAFATLTIQGVRTNLASTQLLGVMNALVKPSKEMAKALNQLNFESGEQAIKTLTLQGALQAVINTTDGSTTAIGALVPRVRGMNAALILTGSGALQFAENLEKINATTADLNKQKALMVMGTDAERVTREWQRLSNAFTADLGPALLQTNRHLFDLVGGADTLITVGRASIPILEASALAIGAWGTKALFAQMASRGWFGALRGLPGLLLGVGAAISAGKFIGEQWAESSAALERLQKANQDALEQFKSAEAQRLKAAIKVDAERVRATRLANLDLMRSYRGTVGGIRQQNDSMVRNATRALDRLVKARANAVKQLEKAAKESATAILASQDRIVGLKFGTEERKFERRTTGLSDAQKSFALSNRATDLATRAARAMAKATDPRAIENAVRLFEAGQRAGEQAEELAAGKGGLAKRAQDVLDAISTQQIRAEKQLQEQQAAIGTAANRRAAREKEILGILRQQTKIIKANLSLFTKQGELFDPATLAERQAQLSAALKEMPVAFNVTQGIHRIQEQLDAAFQDYRAHLTFDVSGLEALTGAKYATPESIFQGMEKLTAQAQAARQSQADAQAAQQRIAALRVEIGQINQDADSVSRKLLRGMGGAKGLNEPILKDLELFRSRLVAISQASVITDEDLKSLKTQLGKIFEYKQERGVAGLFTHPGLLKDVDQFGQALGKLLEIQEQQKVIAAAVSATPVSVLPAMQTFLQTLSQADAHAQSIANSFQRAAIAAQSIPPITGYAAGGMVHLAAGGPAGTDTIPAMLSPGEFVMSAGATRRFASQLVAMNAGVQPVFRSEGGSTTSIGDVAIHVTESKTPQATAEAVWAKLQRAARRGTIRF